MSVFSETKIASPGEILGIDKFPRPSVYACKSKAIWKIPCPIWIRGIASEGNIGPVAGSAHISQFYKMPGIKIFSPINSATKEFTGFS